MMKKIDIPLGHALIIACVIVLVSIGAVTVAQWRYDLADRAEVKVKQLLLPQETAIVSSTSVPTQPVPSTVEPFPETPQPTLATVELPPAMPDVHNAVLNVLAVQSRAPDENDLLIADSEDRVYLQSILDIIFPDGIIGLSEEDISIEILRYVSSALTLGSNSGNATKIFRDGYAQCGGRSVGFRSLVQMAGIPARIVNIYGLLNQGAHTLVEVYYADQWHLFDPTFALFLYSEEEYNYSGHIASLHELLDTSMDGWYFFKVVDKPWSGDAAATRLLGVVRAGEDYMADFYHYPFLSSYAQMFTTAFPVAYDNDQIISFPVVVDLADDRVFFVGEVDGSYSDVSRATAVVDTVGKAGMDYLIGTSSRQYLHTWFIQVPSPGLVRVTYYSTELEPPTLMLFPLKAAHVISASQAGNKAEFLLRISDPLASVQFWSANGVYWVDAIQAEWVGAESPGTP